MLYPKLFGINHVGKKVHLLIKSIFDTMVLIIGLIIGHIHNGGESNPSINNPAVSFVV